MAPAGISAKVFLSPRLHGKFYQVYHDQYMGVQLHQEGSV